MLKLTKKFQNEGLVGQDPVKGFQRALDRQGANVRTAAVVTASCHRYPKRHIMLQGIWTSAMPASFRLPYMLLLWAPLHCAKGAVSNGTKHPAL